MTTKQLLSIVLQMAEAGNYEGVEALEAGDAERLAAVVRDYHLCNASDKR